VQGVLQEHQAAARDCSRAAQISIGIGVVATGVLAAMSAKLFLLISLTLVAVRAYTGNLDFINIYFAYHHFGAVS
jgi:hypothetical protein